MHTIAVINEKGGTAKTTSAVNLAAALGEQGQRVLLVDLDGQAAASRWLGVEEDGRLADAMLRGGGLDPIREVMTHVDLAPASGKLDSVSHELRPTQGGRLKQVLAEVADNYDIVLMDCPPSLGNRLIGNALLAATDAIVPVECSILALDGLRILLTMLDDIRDGFDHEIQLRGILACRYDKRTRLSRLVLGELHRALPGKVFSTVIHENVRLQECPASGQSILGYAGDSSGSVDYRSLATELITGQAPLTDELPAVDLADVPDLDAQDRKTLLDFRSRAARHFGMTPPTPRTPQPQEEHPMPPTDSEHSDAPQPAPPHEEEWIIEEAPQPSEAEAEAPPEDTAAVPELGENTAPLPSFLLDDGDEEFPEPASVLSAGDSKDAVGTSPPDIPLRQVQASIPTQSQPPAQGASKRKRPPLWAAVLLCAALIGAGWALNSLRNTTPAEAIGSVGIEVPADTTQPADKPAALNVSADDQNDSPDARGSEIAPGWSPGNESAADLINHVIGLAAQQTDEAQSLSDTVQAMSNATPAQNSPPTSPSAGESHITSGDSQPSQQFNTGPPAEPTLVETPSRPAASSRNRAANVRLTLSGTMTGSAGGTAIINGQCLRVGQSIDGATLREVYPNAAVVDWQGDSVRLSIGTPQILEAR